MEWRVIPLSLRKAQKKLKTSPQESCFKSLVPKQANHWTNINFSKQNQIPCLPILQYQFVSLFFFKTESLQNSKRKKQKTYVFQCNKKKTSEQTFLHEARPRDEKGRATHQKQSFCLDFWVLNFFLFQQNLGRAKAQSHQAAEGAQVITIIKITVIVVIIFIIIITIAIIIRWW